MKKLIKTAMFVLVSMVIIGSCSKNSTADSDNNDQGILLDGRGGGIILFSRATTAANHNLFAINADGSNRQNLTQGTAYDIQPVWK